MKNTVKSKVHYVKVAVVPEGSTANSGLIIKPEKII